MKKLALQAVITGIRSKVDGSLGLSLSTPELSVEERVEVMSLQNQNLQAVFIPIDAPNAPEYKIDKELDQKTPSQRLRSVLFVLYTQSGSKEEFDVFYNRQMDLIIEKIKERLE